jgi:hypothetical protein
MREARRELSPFKRMARGSGGNVNPRFKSRVDGRQPGAICMALTQFGTKQQQFGAP